MGCNTSQEQKSAVTENNGDIDDTNKTQRNSAKSDKSSKSAKSEKLINGHDNKSDDSKSEGMSVIHIHHNIQIMIKMEVGMGASCLSFRNIPINDGHTHIYFSTINHASQLQRNLHTRSIVLFTIIIIWQAKLTCYWHSISFDCFSTLQRAMSYLVYISIKRNQKIALGEGHYRSKRCYSRTFLGRTIPKMTTHSGVNSFKLKSFGTLYG